VNTNIGNGRNFTPRNPSIFFRVSTYFFLGGIVFPTINIFMRVFNRITVIDKKNASELGRPWILMSNHVTLLDDLFLGPIVLFPKALKGYEWLPFHAPEERNFYKNFLAASIMRLTKSIPLIRGKGIWQEGVGRLIEAVRDGGILHIYPEGTRTRTGKIGEPKVGIGRIVYESGAPVVPMYHRGLEKILPIGTVVPRIFHHVYASVGEPIYFDEELKLPNTPDTWRLIVEKIMKGIYAERDRLSAMLDAKEETKAV